MNRLLARDAELGRIRGALQDGRASGAVVVIEGEPGIGKTSLWLAAVDEAVERGWSVLSARPADAEASFAWAGMCDLLASVPAGALDRLPAPQRRALRVALLLEEPQGAPPEARAIAFAFLHLVSGLSEERPLLVAVDDIQWLDTASALAVGFAMRRADAAPIRFLFALRVAAGAGPPRAMERALAETPHDRLVLGPLATEAIGHILEARLGERFDHATVRAIHATSGGNPLFALEIGRALQARSPNLGVGEEPPIPDDLMALVTAPIACLPQATRDALAVTAALRSPTVGLITAALGHPAEEVLGPAVASSVVRIEGDRVAFTHPLRAAAVRTTTSAAQRRAIHARLAPLVSDQEERARHLALAAPGPDEAVAALLEQAAGRARARGAPDAAAELAAEARRLTPVDRHEDVRRRAAAEATYLWVAGDFAAAQALGSELLATSPPGPAREWVVFELADGANISMMTMMTWAGPDRVPLLRQALADARADGHLRMLLEAVLTGALDLQGDDVRESLVHGYAELELAERLGDLAHVGTALRGIARNTQRLTGHLPRDLIDRSLALEPNVRETRCVLEWPTVCLAEMLTWTDELMAGLERWEWLLTRCTERGEAHSRIDLLARVVPYECVAGLWDLALAHAEEGCELGRDGDSAQLMTTILLADRALVEAHLGDEASARRDASDALGLEDALRTGMARRTAAWALGILELSLGDYARAHEHLGPAVESRRSAGVGEPGDMRLVTDEIEALVGMGRLAEAESMLDWYEALAAASGRVGLLAACGRCRGQLAAARGDLASAAATLGASRDRYLTLTEPFGLGRTLLWLGTVERRRASRRAAREALEASVTLFESLGARIWLDRARAELARVGGRRPSGTELTPSELDVARLVAEGRTNREVASMLVLSERTVEGHLSEVYAKLGIRSRTELARHLSVGPPIGAQAGAPMSRTASG